MDNKRRETPALGLGMLGRRREVEQPDQGEGLEIELDDARLKQLQAQIREVAIYALEGMLAHGKLNQFKEESKKAIEGRWITYEDEDAMLKKARIRY